MTTMKTTQIGKYSFSPKWKEELICIGPMGEFILEFPMGVPTICIPGIAEWNIKFHKHDYSVFREEILIWINNNNLQYSENGCIYQ